MAIIPNLKTKSSRDFWASVRLISQEVALWPSWKRGEPMEKTDAASQKNRQLKKRETNIGCFLGESVTKVEKETVIFLNDEEPHATIWSCQPSLKDRMEKLGINPYREVRHTDGSLGCWYHVPKQWVAVRKPKS